MIGSRVRRTGNIKYVRQWYTKEVEIRAGRGIRAVAHALLAMSQELVPVDTGVLKRSGRVIRHGGGFKTSYTVGYGGYDLPAEEVDSVNTTFVGLRKASDYAVIVHERPATHVIGQHDFLRIPLIQRRDDLNRALGAEVASNANAS